MIQDSGLLKVRDTMAATLPPGLYDDIIANMTSMVSANVIISECNAKSFAGHCRLVGGRCDIRVSSKYTGVRYFLTLTHEIAHAIVWSKYKYKTSPHGKEWKDEYRSFVLRFMTKGYFPLELEQAIVIHMANPPFCAKLHTELIKVLYPGTLPLKEIRCGVRFMLAGDFVYVKTRQRYSTVYFRCVNTNAEYKIHKDTMIRKCF